MNNVASLWQLIERGRKGENIGTSTGLPKLDKIIGGIQPSRYYLIGGSSSSGKSSLVLYMMYHTLKNMTKEEPIYYLYFSLELGQDVILAKLMGLYCAEEFGIYLTLNDIMSFEKTIDDYSYECLKSARKWLDSLDGHITIIDKGLSASTLYKETIPFVERFGTIEEIEGRKQYIPNNTKQKMIGVIDHMSLVHATEGRKLKEEMDLVSSYMVSLKRRFMISWFVLMQQNRDASSIDRRKMDLMEPGLSDLKDSSSMSQDADVVVQIFYPFREKLSTYRDYNILGDNGFKSNFRSLIISKNRYGLANQVLGCAFYGATGWWKDLPPGKDIPDQSIYFDQSKNIPCKIQKQEDLISEDFDSRKEESNKTPITFSF